VLLPENADGIIRREPYINHQVKTITKTYEVYEYSELSKDAQEKALSTWNENNDMPFLQAMLNDECNEMLKEHGIRCDSNHPVCLYSLSHSQGDGLMFEGTFDFKGNSVTIEHFGHYYHHNSAVMTWNDFVGEKEEQNEERIAAEFTDIYRSICKKLEKQGYDIIEDEQSEAHFIDVCNENEWTFTKDGVLLNK
jgi:hypothetical protein